MIPRAEWRALGYVAAYWLSVWLCIQSAMSHSQAAYDAGDKSAFAWMSFLPMVFPMFCFEALLFVLPAVILCESLLAVAWYCGGAKWFL